MATRKMRVPLSKNPADIIALGKKVYDKHLSQGNASPLINMQDHDWKVLGPKLLDAQGYQDVAETAKKQMEKAYRERDLLIKPLDEAIKASRDVLTGIYSKNMKRMGDWGFVVDDTPKAKKEPKTTTK